MADFSITVDITQMTWKDHTGSTLATGDECPLDFVEGVLDGTTYDGVALTFTNGDWKKCGESESQGTSMRVDLPDAGTAVTHTFCVCADEGEGYCFRSGWFDPKLKLKNQDTSGSPSGYQSAGPCSCS